MAQGHAKRNAVYMGWTILINVIKVLPYLKCLLLLLHMISGQGTRDDAATVQVRICHTLWV